MKAEKLSELLDVRCINLDLKGRKKRDIVEELAGLLFEAGKITDPRYVANEILAREKLTSTGIGKGVAIPHRLLRGINETLVAFGRKTQGVNFDAADKLPVKIFFLLIGPETSTAEHLKLLSKLARFLHNDDFIHSLTQAATPEEVIEILRREEEM